jgi:uncharacterized beta-barrel protein YwiB (DUF1934 family)
MKTAPLFVFPPTSSRKERANAKRRDLPVECDLTVQGGRISLEYDLFVDDNLVRYNGLLLNIKEDFPR